MLNHMWIDDDDVKRLTGLNLLLYCRIGFELGRNSISCRCFERRYESKDGGPDSNSAKKSDFLIQGLT
ncbi:hypothetical protein GGE07_001420 [Sinorhizobium terangae]|nr:hypothetical protein [Sinorhizobium terangae]